MGNNRQLRDNRGQMMGGPMDMSNQMGQQSMGTRLRPRQMNNNSQMGDDFMGHNQTGGRVRMNDGGPMGQRGYSNQTGGGHMGSSDQAMSMGGHIQMGGSMASNHMMSQDQMGGQMGPLSNPGPLGR